ncbi:MAG: putative short-subunit dehydrogenase-like oxidoreductase (DUF2520 family) [Parasphingorhabdus sp.]|jgi:predicted short-subunit dehydrogenase-like oxidoreductase (DUF2520 family)
MKPLVRSVVESNITSKSVVILGAGRVGVSIGYLLSQKNYKVTFLARDIERTTALLANVSMDASVKNYEQYSTPVETLLLTVNDDAITPVCDAIVDRGLVTAASRIIHFSGAQSSEVLKSASIVGALTASLHPLQTLPDVLDGIRLLPGSHWFYEGHAGLDDFSASLVNMLGGQLHRIKTASKPLYHASAVLASNYLTAILDAALKCAAQAGLTQQQIMPALLPLIIGTIENVAEKGAAKALTGPIARADIATVEQHLKHLEILPDVDQLYRNLGLYTADLARDSNIISDQDTAQLSQLLNRDKPGSS